MEGEIQARKYGYYYSMFAAWVTILVFAWCMFNNYQGWAAYMIGLLFVDLWCAQTHYRTWMHLENKIKEMKEMEYDQQNSQLR